MHTVLQASARFAFVAFLVARFLFLFLALVTCNASTLALFCALGADHSKAFQTTETLFHDFEILSSCSGSFESWVDEVARAKRPKWLHYAHTRRPRASLDFVRQEAKYTRIYLKRNRRVPKENVPKREKGVIVRCGLRTSSIRVVSMRDFAKIRDS